MIFLVSTVKDSAANLRRHVETNLANGVDHVVLCFDAPDDPEQSAAAASYDDHPDVLVIRCDEAWWAGRRAEALSGRQRTNANVVKAMLAPFGWAQWLFHLDGDETALLDRAVVDGLGAEVSTIKLAPLEAVATGQRGTPTRFKRLLDDDQLDLLHGLGHLRRPTQGLYFHGHTSGKAGLRPRLDHWLSVHSTQGVGGEKLPQVWDDRLHHLHFESFSPDEFARKWVNLLTAGSRPAFRGNRKQIAASVAALLALPLAEEERRALLLEVYERRVQDPVEVLDRLGLLEHVDAYAGRHAAAILTSSQRHQLHEMAARLHDVPKLPFVRQQGLDRATRLVDQASHGLV